MTPHVHLDERVRNLGPSATVAINERVAELASQGKQVYNYGLGQSPFPVPASVVHALRENAHQKAYLAVSGLQELRDATARHLNKTQGLSFDGSRVIVGPGSKELLFLLQVVHEGDLLIPTPGWVSYEPQARILGRRPILVPTRRADDYQLDPDELERLLQGEGRRSRVLILNYPSNPTGTTLDQDRMVGVARVAAKHGLIVVSDEIYGPLRFDGAHRSIAAEYPEGTIVSTGLSKWCGAGGWRLGLMAFPTSLREIQRAMVAVGSETFTSTSAPIQYAAVTAFRGSTELQVYLTCCRDILAGLVGCCWEQLREVGLDAPRPVAAFYLFPDFERYRAALAQREIRTSSALCAALLDELGLASLPGEVFGRAPNELTLRLSLVDFDGGAVLSAHARSGVPDRQFVELYCGRVTGGLERLAAWLRALPSGNLS